MNRLAAQLDAVDAFGSGLGLAQRGTKAGRVELQGRQFFGNLGVQAGGSLPAGSAQGRGGGIISGTSLGQRAIEERPPR